MKTYKITVFHFIMLLFFASCNSEAQKNIIIPGDYDDILHLAYEKGHISGYISYNPYETDAKAVQIGCKLFFNSNVIKEKTQVYNIDLYKLDDSFVKKEVGQIKIDSNKVFLKIGNNFPSCNAALDFNSKDGAFFLLSKRANYRSFNVIKAIKASIFSQIGENNKTKKYLLRGDVVNVSETKDGWSLIEFYGEKKTTGWIRNEELLFRN